MSKITLRSKNALVQIDSIGASICQLRLKGNEILWSGTRPDVGKGITHPCIPNFNIADGLPNHGPARKEEWQQVSEKSFFWSMKEIEGVYPAGIEATRTFEIFDDVLTVTTRVTNHSEQDLPINIAEHNYFRCQCEQRSHVKVNGVLFYEQALNANAKYLPIGGNELRIEIPNLPVIVMSVDGYTSFAQWSQPGAPFVCVEPIQVLPLEPAAFMIKAPKITAMGEKVFWYRMRVG